MAFTILNTRLWVINRIVRTSHHILRTLHCIHYIKAVCTILPTTAANNCCREQRLRNVSRVKVRIRVRVNVSVRVRVTVRALIELL